MTLRPRRIRPGWIPGLALGLVLGVGLAVAVPARSWDPDRSYRKLRIFSQVFNYVENNYVDAVDQESLVYGAVQGMVGTLDPHTQFLPPDQYQKMKEDTTGEFGGLGIEIGVEDGWLTILTPLEDSPARRAGLKAGDRIMAIDGQDAEGMAVADAVALLRGPANTRVTITVMREGWAAPRAVAMVRQRLRLNSIEGRLLDHGVGYIHIKSFQERTERNLKKALRALVREARLAGETGLTGLVLDLRDNPGGLVDEAVRVADLFVSDGEIVTTSGRNRRHIDRQVAHQRGTQPGYPMAILVNSGSASASEIVAGALQDHRRAVVVGSKTYGKGSVQTIIELEDGSGLKLTVARYFTPSGRSINGLGIEPDVAVAEETGAVEADLDRPSADSVDRPLSTALELLQGGQLVGRPAPAGEGR